MQSKEDGLHARERIRKSKSTIFRSWFESDQNHDIWPNNVGLDKLRHQLNGEEEINWTRVCGIIQDVLSDPNLSSTTPILDQCRTINLTIQQRQPIWKAFENIKRIGDAIENLHCNKKEFDDLQGPGVSMEQLTKYDSICTLNCQPSPTRERNFLESNYRQKLAAKEAEMEDAMNRLRLLLLGPARPLRIACSPADAVQDCSARTSSTRTTRWCRRPSSACLPRSPRTATSASSASVPLYSNMPFINTTQALNASLQYSYLPQEQWTKPEEARQVQH